MLLLIINAMPTVGLDVVRTDQALVFYQSESNQAKLWNVLSIYAWVDSDIGYVQGMNLQYTHYNNACIHSFTTFLSLHPANASSFFSVLWGLLFKYYSLGSLGFLSIQYT